MADPAAIPAPPPPPRRPARPFIDGFLRASSRGILPTSLDSRELGARLSGELRRSATFAARMEIASVLQRIRDVTATIVQGPTDADEAARDAGESPLLLSLPEAKARILDELYRANYRPAPDEEGTIKDFTTDARLDLIVSTNEAVVHGHGSWVASLDPDVLDTFPAQELVRISPAEEPRNWPLRWMMAGGTTYGGRMVALKGAPVWDALGNNALFPDALGNPYPPFAFNSGMDVRDVSRAEAEAIGLMQPGAAAPRPDPRALTEGMRVQADRFDELLAEALADNPDIELVDGVLRPRNP